MSQAEILAWLEARPGEWHDTESIASSIGIHIKSVQANVRVLKRHREIEVRVLPGRGGKHEYRHLSPDKKDNCGIRGRRGKSVENRVGQAWRPDSVQVIGEDIFGNVKLFKMPDGHFQCRHCLTVVRIDGRGFAACENCGMIYNDGKVDEKMSKRERKRREERFKYECCNTTS
jgi:hypothetical protein